MKQCSSCGAFVPDDSHFCTSCGARFSEAEKPQAQMPQQAPQGNAPQAGYAAGPAYGGQGTPSSYGAPPQGGYGAPSPQGNAPQYQAPPQPSYGSAPQYQAPSQAPYGAPYSAPPQGQPSYAAQPPRAQNGYGAPYGAPQPPKKSSKKKLLWIIPVVLVVIGVILFLVLGTGSPKSRWQKAERDAATLSKDSVFYPVKEATNYLSGEQKAGFISDVGLNASGGDSQFPLPKDLRLHLETAADYENDDVLLDAKVELMNNQSPGDSVAVTLYNTPDHLVLEAPWLVDQPLLVPYEFMLSSMNLDALPSADALQEAGKWTSLFSDGKLEKIRDDVLDMVFKYVTDPLVEKDQSLEVEGIKEKFEKYTVVLRDDKLLDFMKDLLNYAKKNDDVTSIVEALMQVSGAVDQTPDDMIDDLLDQVEAQRGSFKGGIRRTLYLNGKNEPRSWVITLFNGEEGDESDFATISLNHVQKDKRHAAVLSVNGGASDDVQVFCSYEEVKDKTYTGEIRFYNEDPAYADALATVGFENFTTTWKKPMLLVDGRFSVRTPESEASGAVFNIDCSASEKDGKPYQVLNVRFVYGEAGSMTDIELQTETHILDPATITLKEKSLPSDGVDVSDADALQTLFSDPDIQQKLFDALSMLGFEMAPSY